ncbi:UNVERIFIED_CONTAM: hypothetical protein FKN15_021537 [Acipenser sinensis]
MLFNTQHPTAWHTSTAQPCPLPPAPTSTAQHCSPPQPAQHSPVACPHQHSAALQPPPKLSSNLKTLKECLSVLELEVTELREHILARLSKTSVLEHLRDKVYQLKTEHRAEMKRGSAGAGTGKPGSEKQAEDSEERELEGLQHKLQSRAN